jgi:hypothetical protein
LRCSYFFFTQVFSNLNCTCCKDSARIAESAVCVENGHVMWTGQDVAHKALRCDTALVAGMPGNWEDADATFLQCRYSHAWLQGDQQMQIRASVTTAHGSSLRISYYALCCCLVCWLSPLMWQAEYSRATLHCVTTDISGISPLESVVSCSMYLQDQLSKVIWH